MQADPSEHEYEHDGFDALVEVVANELLTIAADAIARRGRAVFALAGGNTPMPVYRHWAQAQLPWSQIVLLATDERCVGHDQEACNHAALVQAFAAADGVDLRPLTVADGDPERSVEHARALLAQLPEPFDAVILGMGGDGHTASLFPGARQLAAGLAEDAADALRVDPEPLPPEAPFPRVSLSLPRLLRSHTRYLLITGTTKQSVLRAARTQHDPALAPIAAVLQAPGPSLRVHWSP